MIYKSLCEQLNNKNKQTITKFSADECVEQLQCSLHYIVILRNMFEI